MAENVWKRDEENRCLYLPWKVVEPEAEVEDDEEIYYIDYDKCQTPKEALEWLAQVDEKTWSNDLILADLARALVKLV